LIPFSNVYDCDSFPIGVDDNNRANNEPPRNTLGDFDNILALFASLAVQKNNTQEEDHPIARNTNKKRLPYTDSLFEC
jgi:hypothetical protein